MLFKVFMDKISRTSTNLTYIEVGDVKVVSVLFADDVICLAASADDLQNSLGRFKEMCSILRMKISLKKTEIMVISR